MLTRAFRVKRIRMADLNAFRTTTTRKNIPARRDRDAAGAPQQVQVRIEVRDFHGSRACSPGIQLPIRFRIRALDNRATTAIRSDVSFSWMSRRTWDAFWSAAHRGARGRQTEDGKTEENDRILAVPLQTHAFEHVRKMEDLPVRWFTRSKASSRRTTGSSERSSG